PQRFLELSHGDVPVATVRADLAHEEDPVAPVAQSPAHPFFAATTVVLPGVVEEPDPRIDRFVNETDRLVRGRDPAEVIAPETDDRDTLARAAERPHGNLVGHVQLPSPFSSISFTSR